MKRLFLVVLLLLSISVWAAADWTRADVVKVQPDKNRIVLKHERIQSMDMDAMTMQYDVAKDMSLSGYQVGDKVRFQVVMKGGVMTVSALEKLK